MDAAFNSLAAGLLDLVIHLAVTASIYIAGLFVYVKLTPHKEVALIQDGNVAAAISFGGLVIGLAIPLTICLMTAYSVWEILVWGVTSLVLQLFLFRMTDLVLRGLSARIEDGQIASAITLSAFKIAGSLALGAAIMPLALIPA